MSMRARRRLHLCWPHHFGPWQQPFVPYGQPPGWGPPWAGPGRENEKQALADYIAALKEELADAEEQLKELEAGQ